MGGMKDGKDGEDEVGKKGEKAIDKFLNNKLRVFLKLTFVANHLKEVCIYASIYFFCPVYVIYKHKATKN